jgi:hypothetical protein
VTLVIMSPSLSNTGQRKVTDPFEEFFQDLSRGRADRKPAKPTHACGCTVGVLGGITFIHGCAEFQRLTARFDQLGHEVRAVPLRLLAIVSRPHAARRRALLDELASMRKVIEKHQSGPRAKGACGPLMQLGTDPEGSG